MQTRVYPYPRGEPLPVWPSLQGAPSVERRPSRPQEQGSRIGLHAVWMHVGQVLVEGVLLCRGRGCLDPSLPLQAQAHGHHPCATTLKCQKTKCACDGFDSPWVCNCDHPLNDHVQELIEKEFKPLDVFQDQFQVEELNQIARTDLLAESMRL